MTTNWKDKRILITGGASGMGRASVLKLAALGAQVIALDRNREALEALASLAAGSGGGSVAVVACDLAEPEQIARVFAGLGPIDAAVNAAAIGQQVQPLERIDLATMDQIIAINFRAVALCMQAELPLIRARGGGAIVNLSSSGGLRGAAGVSIYCAVKHAVLGLTRSVAAEVAGENIRVNAVCPGLTDTPMLRGLVEYEGADPDLIDRMAEPLPIGRLAVPDEIADAIVWLIGDSASYVVGAAISVDGGFTAI